MCDSTFLGSNNTHQLDKGARDKHSSLSQTQKRFILFGAGFGWNKLWKLKKLWSLEQQKYHVKGREEKEGERVERGGVSEIIINKRGSQIGI